MGGDAVAAQCLGAKERVVGLLHQMRGVVFLAECRLTEACRDVQPGAGASCSSLSLSMFEGLVMDFETHCKRMGDERLLRVQRQTVKVTAIGAHEVEVGEHDVLRRE